MATSEQDVYAARMNGLAALYETSEAVALVEVNYSNLLNTAEKVSEADRTYAEAVKETNADVNLSTEERKAKLDELSAKHSETTQKIISDNLLQQLSLGGLEQAEFELYTKYQVSTGQMEQSAAAQALAIDAVTRAVAEGTLSVDLLRESIALLENKTVTITVEEIRRYSAETARYEGLAGLYGQRAEGGPVMAGKPYLIGEKGPEVFVPNQSGTVIPNAGGASMNALGGGGMVVVNVNINSPITTLDKENMKNLLAPFITDGIRKAQSQGVIK